jgi:hypothetical protein
MMYVILELLLLAWKLYQESGEKQKTQTGLPSTISETLTNRPVLVVCQTDTSYFW